MEIYLIRHTKPLIEDGVCYGQTDVPLDENSFEAAFDAILEQLPVKIDAIHSSPLIRCSYLAQQIHKIKTPAIKIKYDDRLKELNFGNWEMMAWNDIPRKDMDKWANNFLTESTPCGESNIELHQRVIDWFDNNIRQGINIVVVTHAGVIRSILTYLKNTSLADAFSLYPLQYGGVIILSRNK